jgi:hypothetical protein
MQKHRDAIDRRWNGALELDRLVHGEVARRCVVEDETDGVGPRSRGGLDGFARPHAAYLDPESGHD